MVYGTDDKPICPEDLGVSYDDDKLVLTPSGTAFLISEIKKAGNHSINFRPADGKSKKITLKIREDKPDSYRLDYFDVDSLAFVPVSGNRIENDLFAMELMTVPVDADGKKVLCANRSKITVVSGGFAEKNGDEIAGTTTDFATRG